MFRIRQTETGWVVEHAGADIASFTAGAEPDGLRRAYGKGVAFIGEQARTLLAAQVASPEDGLLVDKWTSKEGIVFARETGDGRVFTDCKFTWRDPAQSLVPLMLQTQTDFGHFGAELAGFHEAFARVGDAVTSHGRFYDSDVGREARDLLLGGRFFGVSVDGGAVEVEFTCTEEEDGWCIDGVLTFLAYEIIGSTMTPFPAFATAAIQLDAPAAEASVVVSVAAAATDAPAVPPRAWFEMAEPDDDDERYVDQGGGRIAIPLHIGDDGQVFGHIAARGVAHTGYPGQNIQVPSSASSYAHFNLAALPCDDGSRVTTGVLTVGCDHAPLSYTAQQARDFYAHSGLGWADVHASEGEFGVWVAGAVRPGLDARQVRMIHGSTMSGDWRPISGTLEMVGVHSVNQPGFPVLREVALAACGATEDGQWFLPSGATGPKVRVIGDEVVALVAAGVVRDCPECAKRRAQQMAITVGMGREVMEILSAIGNALDALTGDVGRIERRTRHLIPVEQQASVTRIHAALERDNGRSRHPSSV